MTALALGLPRRRPAWSVFVRALAVAAFVLGLFSPTTALANPLEKFFVEAMSAGPSGPWTRLPHNPTGDRMFVRGMSGVGWAKGSAVEEIAEVLGGKAIMKPRFIQPVTNLSEGTFAQLFANPFMVAGKVDASRITADLADPAVASFYPPDQGAWATEIGKKEILKPGHSAQDLFAIRVAHPLSPEGRSLNFSQWVDNYMTAAEQFAPKPGSPGAQFLDDLKALWAQKKTIEEPNPFGEGTLHRWTNHDEIQTKFYELLEKHPFNSEVVTPKFQSRFMARVAAVRQAAFSEMAPGLLQRVTSNSANWSRLARFGLGAARFGAGAIGGLVLGYAVDQAVTHLTGSKDLGFVAGYAAGAYGGYATEAVIFGTSGSAAGSIALRASIYLLPLAVHMHIMSVHINGPLEEAMAQGDEEAAKLYKEFNWGFGLGAIWYGVKTYAGAVAGWFGG